MTYNKTKRIRRCLKVLGQLNRIERKLDLLMAGSHLLAADQAMKRQEASERTPKGD